MTKDNIIEKLQNFNNELLGIINYLDEKSVIYGLGQMQALQEDIQMFISELSALESEQEKYRTCNVQSCRNPVNEGEFMCIIHDQRFHEPEDNILPDNKEYD